MTTQSINSISPPTTSTSAPTTKSFNDMSSEDFFGLLIAQLQSQDPLKPTDNQTLMTQMSTIKQMQTSSQLNNTLTTLASSQRFGSTSALIGQYVAGTVTDNAGNPTTVQGVVAGVHFDNKGNAILELHNGINLPADKVTDVTVVQNLPPDLQQQIAAQSAAAAASKNKLGLSAARSAPISATVNVGQPGASSAAAANQSRTANILNAILGGVAA